MRVCLLARSVERLRVVDIVMIPLAFDVVEIGILLSMVYILYLMKKIRPMQISIVRTYTIINNSKQCVPSP